jgi:hypothetical protein
MALSESVNMILVDFLLLVHNFMTYKQANDDKKLALEPVM